MHLNPHTHRASGPHRAHPDVYSALHYSNLLLLLLLLLALKDENNHPALLTLVTLGRRDAAKGGGV